MSKRLTPYQRMRRDSAERKAKIIELYDLGWRQRKIARFMRVSDAWVSQIVRAYKAARIPGLRRLHQVVESLLADAEGGVQ